MKKLQGAPAPTDEVPEYVIKRNIITWLRYNGVFAWCQSNAAIWDAKRGSYRKMSALQKRGVADVLGIWNGRFLAIEVKSKTGKLSPYQQEFLDDVNRHGGIGFMARSIEDVATKLNSL